MPTNDERREVAKRIREMYYYGGIKRSVAFYEALNDVIMGQDGFGSFQDIADRLADLIKPEERTCRNIAGKPFAGYRMFSCSECGAYLEVDGGADANLFAGGERPMPRYCPNCGARVIQE